MGQQDTFDPILNSKLQTRGISDTTRHVFEIENYHRDGLTGWMYPTPAGSLRFKNLNSAGQPKYAWLNPATQRLEAGQRRPDDVFYHAPDFAQAVQAASGVAWVVSGEADVWATHSAGLAAFAFNYGEGARIPDGLGLFCLQMGITTLRAAPDLDAQGQGWVNRMADQVGHLLTAYRLPGAMGSKYDLGKAWVEFLASGQGGDFEAWLTQLPLLNLQPQTLPIKRATGYLPPVGGLFNQWKLEIIAHYQAQPGKGTRHYIHCPNPHHADQNESFRIDKDKGPVCTCGIHHEEHKWDLVAEWLGLPTYAEYQHRQRETKYSPRPQRAIRPTPQIIAAEPPPDLLPPVEALFEGLALEGQYLWPQGVPDVLRTCFLTIDQLDKPIRQKGAKAVRYFKNHAPALILYELIHQGAAHGQLNPQQFSRDDLRACAAQHGLTISEYGLKLGLDQLEGVGFLRKLQGIEKLDHSLGAKFKDNPNGRPEDVFTLVPIRPALNALLSRMEVAIRQAVYADQTPDAPTNIETERAYLDLLAEVDKMISPTGYPEQQIAKLYGSWAAKLNPKALAAALSTPLAAGFDWGNKSGYTDAFNRGKLEAVGGKRQIPNKLLASELGCSENALRASNKRANILSMEHYEYVEIEPGASRQKVESVLLGRGRAWWIAEGFEYEKAIKPERLWLEIEQITHIVEQGGTVTVRIQTASIHTPSTPEQIEALAAVRREKLRAIRAYKEQHPLPDCAPVESPPSAKVEALPIPAAVLSEGVTLQYILDQYHLRIRVLDLSDPRRQTLINRLVELQGGHAHEAVVRYSASQPEPTCQSVLNGPASVRSPAKGWPASG